MFECFSLEPLNPPALRDPAVRKIEIKVRDRILDPSNCPACGGIVYYGSHHSRTLVNLTGRVDSIN
jgi:uncharacterized protein with PIN domain